MAGWGGPWSSLLRRLVIPEGAGPNDPRIVIATDDPLAVDAGQDAAIVFNWWDGRGFILGVENSGGLGDTGQLHLWALDENRLAQFIDITFAVDPLDSDQLVLRGGNGYIGIYSEEDIDMTTVNGAVTYNGYEVLRGLRDVESITFGPPTQTTFTRSVPFGTTLPSVPTVSVAIQSAAGPTANWHVRPFNVTTTGFDIFGFGPAVSWAGVPVSWSALF